MEEAIKLLPPAQQEAVRCCFEASKKKSPSGRRYTLEWVYECMLMRIKSPSLYQHIREHEILPLPCNSTIRGYLRHYSGAYGFNPSTMKMLKEKSRDMAPEKRRGSYTNTSFLFCFGFGLKHEISYLLLTFPTSHRYPTD